MSAAIRITDDALIIQLPTLSPEQALAVVDVLEAACNTIWERYDATSSASCSTEPMMSSRIPSRSLPTTT